MMPLVAKLFYEETANTDNSGFPGAIPPNATLLL